MVSRSKIKISKYPYSAWYNYYFKWAFFTQKRTFVVTLSFQVQLDSTRCDWTSHFLTEGTWIVGSRYINGKCCPSSVKINIQVHVQYFLSFTRYRPEYVIADRSCAACIIKRSEYSYLPATILSTAYSKSPWSTTFFTTLAACRAASLQMLAISAPATSLS